MRWREIASLPSARWKQERRLEEEQGGSDPFFDRDGRIKLDAMGDE